MNFWQKWLRRKPDDSPSFAPEKLPRHVAIIMDGNGRWAKGKGLPRVAGHRMGMQTVKRITIAANNIGIKVLTLYAFSTENWKRPRDEVEYLMKLPMEFLRTDLEELHQNNVCLRMMGWMEDLPEETQKAIREALDKTKNNTGMILNFALNYGSRKEIICGMKRIFGDLRDGILRQDELTEETFSRYLLSGGLPDPDLLIRTSGELRISNFMLWQLAYTELWFTDVNWPDFTEEHFYEALRHYERRKRRYGGLV